jgi:signal transduction histidine kinase
VIENLLKNALDAMEGKGKITIDISNGSDAVIIDIADTGKGISRQNVAKVLSRVSLQKKEGGGLALVYLSVLLTNITRAC